MTQEPVETYYSDTFPLPLPPGHRFPIAKYRRLRERLEQSPLSTQLRLREAPAANEDQLLLVHTRDYLDRLRSGALTELEQRRIGFPWSTAGVERARRSTGATVAAARAAMRDGYGIHLAGGTHHAFPDHGQGFCVFNDAAVAIRVMKQAGWVRRALVIDLDVHQGNGTAAIFAADASVYTFSMHGAENFPFRKTTGDLDVPLPAGTGDEAYLDRLQKALRSELPFEAADIVMYLAGSDPYEQDRFGRLRLTKRGLRERDRRVFASCREHGVPVVVMMAGGYARDVEDVVSINVGTIEALLESRTQAAQSANNGVDR